LLDVPVVDITEAAASTAMFLGHKYSVVTTLDRTVPLIEDRLKLAGLLDRCASVRAGGMAVLDLERDREAAPARPHGPSRRTTPKSSAWVAEGWPGHLRASASEGLHGLAAVGRRDRSLWIENMTTRRTATAAPTQSTASARLRLTVLVLRSEDKTSSTSSCQSSLVSSPTSS
jgi:hypothetical protein